MNGKEGEKPCIMVWNVGEHVVVQIPEEDGYSTYTGTIVGVDQEGKVEVHIGRHGKTFLCEPEWVYPEDWWLS